MNKREARREALKRRRGLTAGYRERASGLIAERLILEEVWKRASVIFLYYGYGDEVQTGKLMEAGLSEGKRIFLPRVVSDKDMVFIEISSFEELKAGAYGIPEPVYNEKKICREVPELVAVPCVACDRRGGRAGHGKGYYDRSLCAYKGVPFVCLAYDCQLLDSIETDGNDIGMDIIITEKEVIRT